MKEEINVHYDITYQLQNVFVSFCQTLVHKRVISPFRDSYAYYLRIQNNEIISGEKITKSYKQGFEITCKNRGIFLTAISYNLRRYRGHDYSRLLLYIPTEYPDKPDVLSFMIDGQEALDKAIEVLTKYLDVIIERIKQ